MVRMASEDRLEIVADLRPGTDGLLRLLCDFERFGTSLAQLVWTSTKAGATARLEFTGSLSIPRHSLISRLERHPSIRKIAFEQPEMDALPVTDWRRDDE
jgi:hypothetical protein